MSSLTSCPDWCPWPAWPSSFLEAWSDGYREKQLFMKNGFQVPAALKPAEMAVVQNEQRAPSCDELSTTDHVKHSLLNRFSDVSLSAGKHFYYAVAIVQSMHTHLAWKICAVLTLNFTYHRVGGQRLDIRGHTFSYEMGAICTQKTSVSFQLHCRQSVAFWPRLRWRWLTLKCLAVQSHKCHNEGQKSVETIWKTGINARTRNRIRERN